MRVATIDIGTNTILLLVADGSADSPLQSVAERATITRLGEGVDRARRFAPVAVARTLACLDEYTRVVRELGAERTVVVGTSAMRDEGGGQQIRAYVQQAFGVDVRVLSGEEEARLTFRGALGNLAVDANEEVAVFDIGGGSTEVVLGRMVRARASIAYAESFDVGSVRLTERHLANDPPTHDERQAIARAASNAFAGVPRLQGAATLIGIAGTMTTLAAVSLGLVPYDGARVHGHTMRMDEVRRVVEGLARLALEDRRKLPGMEPKRADVILAGGMIAIALLDHWGVDAVRISDRGVRWGLAEELTRSPRDSAGSSE